MIPVVENQGVSRGTRTHENREYPEFQNYDLLKEKSDIFEITGRNGLWQFCVFFLLFILSIPGAAQHLSMSFMAPEVDYWCARPSEASNVSIEFWKKTGLPENDQHCIRYANIIFPLDENRTSTKDFSTLPCVEWEYDHSFYSATLLEEFDLVCNREWLISLSKSLFMAGILVAALLVGILSDRFGRRPTITGCCIITFISGGICAFSTSFTLFLFARFLTAVGIGGYYCNLFVLLMEVVGPELRAAYSNTVQWGWAVGFVCLPGIVWCLRDWFWIQIALTLPYSVFMAVWWMIPESPIWLLSKGKTEKAKEMLIKAAEMNRRKIAHKDMEEIISSATLDSESIENNGNMLDLLTTPSLRKITLIVVFSWSVIAFIYYGLSFNTNDLVGDPFVNFAASGAAEFPGYGFGIIAMRYFGRRKSASGTMIAAGLICFLSYFAADGPVWLSMTLPVIGKFFITSCFGIIYTFTTELFPTVIRSSALGLADTFGVIGSSLAPFVHELGHATQPFVPFCLFGILAFASGLLTLLLPETANRKLPNTIREAVAFSRITTPDH